MNKLALTLPGFTDIPQPTPLGSKFTDLGSLLSEVLNIIFYAGLFLAFFYLVWGAFAYIMAQGKKEELAKARARLTWALIGLMVILLSFFVAKFIAEILKPTTGGVPF